MVVTFSQVMEDPARRERIIRDCVSMVEQEVGDKRGLTGMALKAGFAAFQRLQPGILRAAVDRLLPDLARAVEPHWQAACAEASAERAFCDRAPSVASDLLGVTDRLVGRAKSATVAQLYRSLRPSAADHVAAAVPRLAKLLRDHLGP